MLLPLLHCFLHPGSPSKPSQNCLRCRHHLLHVPQENVSSPINCLSRKSLKPFIGTKQLHFHLSCGRVACLLELLLVLPTEKTCSGTGFYLNVRISTKFRKAYSTSLRWLKVSVVSHTTFSLGLQGCVHVGRGLCLHVQKRLLLSTWEHPQHS